LHDGQSLVVQILEHTDILFVNKEEAEELVLGHVKLKHNNEIKYIRELLVKLTKMGAKAAVVTNGRYGSHAIDEYGNFYHEGLYPGEVVERTGAGDAYTSGFLAATLYGQSIKESMKWGAVDAASVVEKVGSIEGLLSRNELEKRAGERETSPVSEKRYFQHLLGQAIGKLRLKH
jgi:sugar/nucleoside kinase (ribokinase family)